MWCNTIDDLMTALEGVPLSFDLKIKTTECGMGIEVDVDYKRKEVIIQ